MVASVVGRDFCGRCIDEYMLWSIKQLSDSQLGHNPVAVRTLLLRIYGAALHPNQYKRLGAAIAINSCYRRFREHESLVDQYLLEMLITMISSLQYSDHSGGNDAASGPIGLAIGHLLRMIIDPESGYREQLTVHSERRRRPRNWSHGESITLANTMKWLFSEMGRPERELRKNCIEVFFNLVGLRKEGEGEPDNGGALSLVSFFAANLI